MNLTIPKIPHWWIKALFVMEIMDFWRIHEALALKGHLYNLEWVYMSKNTYCSVGISVKFGLTVNMSGLLFGVFCHIQNKWIYFSNQAGSGCQLKDETYNCVQTFCYESYIIPRWIQFHDDTMLSGSSSHVAGKTHYCTNPGTIQFLKDV